MTKLQVAFTTCVFRGTQRAQQRMRLPRTVILAPAVSARAAGVRGDAW
jgi:hypothetical protein